MNGWVILVDQARDFPNADTPHKVITTGDYLARPKLFAGLGRAKIINLSRSYNYQSKGYYASLLAEARGHRVIPTVETMLDLRELKLYEQSLPELQEALTAAASKAHATEDTTFDLLFCFGFAQDQRFEAFGRLLFDWYRCPAIEVTITPGKRWKIDRLRARPLAKLGPDETEFFRTSLHRHTQRDWRNPRGRPIARYSLAVLHDPQDELPPSSPETLRHFQRIAEKQSVEVELITRRQLAELAEFDALFIRATTSIDNFTYRFAAARPKRGHAGHRRSAVDDPLHQQGLPARASGGARRARAADGDAGRRRRPHQGRTPARLADGGQDSRRLVLARRAQGRERRGAEDAVRQAVRGHRPPAGAEIHADQIRLAGRRAGRRAAVRLPVPDGARPLADHQARAERSAGGRLEDACRSATRRPPVIDAALKAARAIGPGLYGVDIKETDGAIVVIEVNDNPNLEHGVEDQIGKDEVWTRILNWFIKRIDA